MSKSDIPVNPLSSSKALSPKEILAAARCLVEINMADGETLSSFQVDSIADYLFEEGGVSSLKEAVARVNFWIKQEIAKQNV